MKKQLYKKIGPIKIYLSDIKGYQLSSNKIVIEKGPDKELTLLKALREYNLKINGAKSDDMQRATMPILAKCQRNPLLIPHRLNREYAKIRRREKQFLNS